jgi:hypothetical protein
MFVQVGLIYCTKADCNVSALIRRHLRKNSGQRIAYASVALKTYYFIWRLRSILKLEAAECQLVVELVEDVLQDLFLRSVATVPDATHCRAVEWSGGGRGEVKNCLYRHRGARNGTGGHSIRRRQTVLASSGSGSRIIDHRADRGCVHLEGAQAVPGKEV